MVCVELDLELVGILEVVVEEVYEVLETMLPFTYVLDLHVVVLQVLNLLVEHHQVEHDHLIFNSTILIDKDSVLFDLVETPSVDLVDVEFLDAALHDRNKLPRRRVDILEVGG